MGGGGGKKTVRNIKVSVGICKAGFTCATNIYLISIIREILNQSVMFM